MTEIQRLAQESWEDTLEVRDGILAKHLQGSNVDPEHREMIQTLDKVLGNLISMGAWGQGTPPS